MASKLKDFKPRSINLKSPMRRSANGGFATNTTTLEAIKDDLLNLLLTNHGERVINYDFGANLRPVLFENMDNTEERVADSISTAVDKWLPFVNIKDLTVDTNESDPSVLPNAIRIVIKFSVSNTNLNDELEVVLRR